MSDETPRGVSSQVLMLDELQRPSPPTAPVLLADATWWGTLAAARDLGRRGIPVTLASDSVVAPARWSRYVSRVVRCPPTADADRFLDWLRSFGQEFPGHVLCATSDETAWYYSLHRAELSRWFHLDEPPPDAVRDLLDKSRLMAAARIAGLDVPDTWCPDSEADVGRLASSVPMPLYVKPRAQLLIGGAGKGHQVRHPDALLPAWKALRDTLSYHPDVRARMPGVELPLIQAATGTAERIYTIDGFIEESGEACAMRGCVKLLQLPRGSGPGIVFTSAPVLPAVAAGLLRLFRSVGFRGPFDAEFLEYGPRLLLIDINPRFYNHMAFEHGRGLPLAWLTYLKATGASGAVHVAVQEAVPDQASGTYVHHLALWFLFLAQGFAGRLSPEERTTWRAWLRKSGRGVTDPTADPLDRGPVGGAMALELVRMAKHPRSYLRALLNRPPDAPP